LAFICSLFGENALVSKLRRSNPIWLRNAGIVRSIFGAELIFPRAVNLSVLTMFIAGLSIIRACPRDGFMFPWAIGLWAGGVIPAGLSIIRCWLP
jgi:hypothetical protein